MELFRQKKTLDILNDFFIRGKNDVTRVSYYPSKTVCPAPVTDYFPRATPESRGIPSEHLSAMLSELEHSNRTNVHSLTVLADGAVICEASAPGYDRRLPHETHSLCKSIVGLAIGMLHDDGLFDLDTPAFRFFSAEALPSRLSGKAKAITVRHLLTMSSGVSFAETGAVTSEDWVRSFFAADVRFEPGSEFSYNSMNTYILSAIVREVSGKGLSEFLGERLFRPLHIEHYFFECCPHGIEKGGWGLYIAQEDLAKIAHMCLSGGVFEGKRIISREWLTEAFSTKKITPREAGGYNYAYQTWCARDKSAYLFNGMLGQDVWVSKTNRLAVITNAGNNEFFQQSAMLAIIEKYLGTDFTRSEAALTKAPRALRALRLAEEHFFRSRAWIEPLPTPRGFSRLWRRLLGRPTRPLPRLCERLSGRRFSFPQNNSGILPVFTRLMQNNHTSGIGAISFLSEGERFFVCFDEGEGEIYRIEASFYGYASGILNVRGEHYRVSSCAAFATDEDGHRLLKLDVVFPELSHTRRVKIFFDEAEVRLSMRELPGKEVLSALFSSVPVSYPRAKGIMNFMRDHVNLDYLLLKMYDKFEPTLLCPLSFDSEKKTTENPC